MAGTNGVVLIPVLTLVLVRRIRLFRVQRIEEWPAMWAGDIGPVLWMEPAFGEFLRGIGPSLAAAIVAGGGMAALAGGNPVSACLLLAVAVAMPAWRWPMADRAGRKSGWSVEAALAAVLMVIMVNWVARPRPGDPEARVRRPPLVAASRTGGDLSGVILTLPVKPREKVLPLPPIQRGGPVTTATRPVRIEFDGVYWYFQAPDPRPPRGAKVVKGDPMRAQIRSTNTIPIQMEAHQRLPENMSMDLYREIVVTVKDADSVPGLIRVSLLLAGEKTTQPLLLGARVLEASRTQRGFQSRSAVEEELHFVVTPAARDRSWSELVVRIEPESARAQAGAHVMVKNFLLEP